MNNVLTPFPTVDMVIAMAKVLLLKIPVKLTGISQTGAFTAKSKRPVCLKAVICTNLSWQSLRQHLQPCEKKVFVACSAAPTLACLMYCIWMLQRLVAHAEEVAYNDPPSGAAEQLILNQHLYRLLRHNKLSAFQRFVQQVCAVPLLGVCFCSRAVLAMTLCLVDSAELTSKFRTCCMSAHAFD